ncbi:MAG TPA: hypothetical protein VGJ16_03665 [Pirellulales bacterium]|jgi:hypothetical protein
MFRTTRRALVVLPIAVCAILAVRVPAARAAHPDIFYNFYVGPTACGAGTPAQLYVSPRPTPEYVGHTYLTYPPLLPHEFLYHHHRSYYKYYRNGGYTTSHVRYHTQHVTPFLARTLTLQPW